MKVLFASAELAPLIKVGGLADVVGSLPKAFLNLGIESCVVIPRYGCLNPDEWGLTLTDWQYTASVGDQQRTIGLWQGVIPATQIPLYALELFPFASRQFIYDQNDAEEGFAYEFFAQAVLKLIEDERVPRSDIIHTHDWHMGPLTVALKHWRETQSNPDFKTIRSVFTIHNLAYQGHTPYHHWLPEAISSADAITTVSETYAQEIQTPQFGCGLEGLLQARSGVLTGIVNGIDTAVYNPQTDPFIPQVYDQKTVASGKAKAKQSLQKQLGLPEQADVPLVAFVGRLTAQKGLDILLPALRQIQATYPTTQWVILGSGEPAIEQALRDLHQQYTTVRNWIGMNLPLAQQIYAASDVFVMPSRFEPCGLGQLIALRYGSIPVVHKVGGLADTIFDYRDKSGNESNLNAKGNGLCFSDYTDTALVATLEAALKLYQDKTQCQILVQNAMTSDVSWEKSAHRYQVLYQRLSSNLVTLV